MTQSLAGIANIATGNAAVAQEVSASTEELTASAQQTAAATRDLQRIADALQCETAQFQL